MNFFYVNKSSYFIFHINMFIFVCAGCLIKYLRSIFIDNLFEKKAPYMNMYMKAIHS